jgi:hypothetical protein
MTLPKTFFILTLFIFTSCNQERKAELSFDGCTISYSLYSGGEKKLFEGHYIQNEMEIEAARRKLALCLCGKYLQSQDTNVKAKIVEIYQIKEHYFARPFGSDLPFDSILVHKEKVFDPTILID